MNIAPRRMLILAALALLAVFGAPALAAPNLQESAAPPPVDGAPSADASVVDLPVGHGQIETSPAEVAEPWSLARGILQPPAGGNGILTCEPCSGGVTELQIAYLGAAPARITVMQGVATVYDAVVSPDGNFALIAPGAATFAPRLDFLVDGAPSASLQTDCGVAVGPFLVFGPGGIFQINGGWSKAGPLCLVPDVVCDLRVTKTCELLAQPSSGNDCHGKVTRLVFEYTGEDCSATTNLQSGKATCSGDPAGASPVGVVVTKDADKSSLSPNGETLVLGGLLTVQAVKELPSETKLDIRLGGTTLQSLTIHTSCSKPLAVGDQFGALRLVAMDTTEGGTTSLPAPAAPAQVCEASLPAAPFCDRDNKPEMLTWRYTGGGCAASDNGQPEDKWKCEGQINGNATAFVKPGGGDDFYIDPGQTFTIKRKDSDKFELSNAGGKEKLEIHTSCSQPLAIGDVFGSLTLVAIDGQGDPAVRVRYAYAIENLGDDVSGLSVNDDQLGAIAAGLYLPRFGKLSFEAEASLDETTTNVVTVGGILETGYACGGSASATVKIAPPPTPQVPWVCQKPIDSLSMIWVGAQAVRVKAWKGAVGSSLLADIDNIAYGQVVTVVGFAGSPNDVIWEVFKAGTSTKLGESKFHLSCSDDDMDGPEDCGKLAGNGKDNSSSLINSWLLAGMVGAQGSFECPPPGQLPPPPPPPPPAPWVCQKPIDSLTMRWAGSQAVRVKAWKGAVGSTLLADVASLAVGQELTVVGFAGSPNDVIWEIFKANSSVKLGESKFHLSCSDGDMNGPDDCGKRQGNGKENSSSLINDWILEGMVGATSSFDCTP